MSGLNLLGANQWQTLQMQETTRPAVQPAVRPIEADPRLLPSPQPGIQTPVETARAARFETMQDHVDLSLREGLEPHEKGREEHRDGSEGEGEGDSGHPHPIRTFADREEALLWLCGCDDAALAQQEAQFHFTPGVRDMLARLGQIGAGRAGAYARQSRLTASNGSLLTRTLSDGLHRLEAGHVDEGGKCLAILLGAAEGVEGWEAYLTFAVEALLREDDLEGLAVSLRLLLVRLSGQGSDGGTWGS